MTLIQSIMVAAHVANTPLREFMAWATLSDVATVMAGVESVLPLINPFAGGDSGSKDKPLTDPDQVRLALRGLGLC